MNLSPPSSPAPGEDRAPAEGPATPPSAPARRLYFINGPVDFLCVGGLSILVFVFLRGFHGNERTESIIGIAYVLLWIVNWPHFAATNYRLYHSKANIRQYPMTALVVPWVVLAGVAGSLAMPDQIAPFFVKVFLIWSPYHFSGQTVGVTLIYARRAGFRFGKLERFFLSAFVFGTFIATAIGAEVIGPHKPGMSYGVEIPQLGVPVWAHKLALAWMYSCGIMLVLLILRMAKTTGRMLPLIVLVPAAAQFVWFVPGGGWPSFVEFVPLFHSLQYMLIAWSMQLKERMDREHIAPSRGYVAGETLRWGLLNFAGGAALFFFIPKAIAWGGVPADLALGVFIAGVQIHHFFVDGVIWKLKSPAVSSPLMVNVDELLHSPTANAPARQRA